MKRRNIVSAWLKSVWIDLLCTFGIACRQVEPVQEKTLQILNPETPVSVSLDDMVDSIAFIPLETSDNCLLGYIMSAKRDGNHCFVQDERGLFVFDSKGKFLNEIGHKGDGPEEYHAMDCYGIDRLHKLVWIFCAIERKVIRYNYDGSYHSTLLLDEKDANVSSFRVGDDGTLFAYFPLPNKAMEIDKACCVFRRRMNGLFRKSCWMLLHLVREKHIIPICIIRWLHAGERIILLRLCRTNCMFSRRERW